MRQRPRADKGRPLSNWYLLCSRHATFVDIDDVILGNGGTGRMSSLVGPPHEFSGPVSGRRF
jgi:hypothetical protein